MDKVEKRAAMVTRLISLSEEQKATAGLNVLDNAARTFLEDGLISDQEQQRMDEFSRSLHLPVHNLPAAFSGGGLEKVEQASILRQLQRGQRPPARQSPVPIMLAAGEQVIWHYSGVSMYQEKIVKEWVGRSSGMSFRVMKGVYYRVGGSKGRPVEHSTMELQGKGTLVLTNKNVIFYSQTKSAKFPYKKLVGVTPYSDGVELHKDEANPKRTVLQGFDSWFMVNLLSLVGNA